DGLHVDRVEVGALLAVDLDVDEVLVHQGGGRLVLERLLLHLVAPVARRITYAQQDRSILLSRLRQRLRPPGVPIDRIVGMLKQIRTGLIDEPVGLCWHVAVVHLVTHEALSMSSPCGSSACRSSLHACGLFSGHAPGRTPVGWCS